MIPFFYMWYFYILYSEKIDRFYYGFTDDLQWRLERHNAGWGRFTRRGIPWKLVYYESFQTKTEAIHREKEIKRMKNRRYIQELIQKSYLDRKSHNKQKK